MWEEAICSTAHILFLGKATFRLILTLADLKNMPFIDVHNELLPEEKCVKPFLCYQTWPRTLMPLL
jgi:hypothetical protein